VRVVLVILGHIGSGQVMKMVGLATSTVLVIVGLVLVLMMETKTIVIIGIVRGFVIVMRMVNQWDVVLKKINRIVILTIHLGLLVMRFRLYVIANRELYKKMVNALPSGKVAIVASMAAKLLGVIGRVV
tara:strand:- start:100 stop:486 length:387 start_codon:yes stop_codon:yes gene_type:complete